MVSNKTQVITASEDKTSPISIHDLLAALVLAAVWFAASILGTKANAQAVRNPATNTVEIFTANGQAFGTILTTKATPHGIAVDPINKRIYYARPMSPEWRCFL